MTNKIAYSSSAQSRTCSPGDESHIRNLNRALSGIDSRGMKLIEMNTPGL